MPRVRSLADHRPRVGPSCCLVLAGARPRPPSPSFDPAAAVHRPTASSPAPTRSSRRSCRRRYEGKAPDSVDSGRTAPRPRSGRWPTPGSTRSGSRGATWPPAGRAGSRSRCSTGEGLDPAAMLEFYEAGARDGVAGRRSSRPRTRRSAASPPSASTSCAATAPARRPRLAGRATDRSGSCSPRTSATRRCRGGRGLRRDPRRG